MNNSIAQHPVLWLILAFLLGITVEWLLEVFYFRRPLSDARAAARRRGEDLDSERFAHGRTQSELKSVVAELETANKGRALAEAHLGAARTRIQELESAASSLDARRESLEAELARTRRYAEATEAERQVQAGEVVGLRLQLAELEAAWTTESSVAAQLRTRCHELQRTLDQALERMPALEADAVSQATKAQALEADFQAAMRRHADAESAIGEIRGALSAAQDELETARTGRLQLEGELATAKARIQKLESAGATAKSGSTALEQKLKARIDEVKQLTAQLGEATEELAAIRAKAAQLEANLTAAQATRKALEKELAERPTAATAPAPNPTELAAAQERVREREQEVASWKNRAEELEAELLATSRAHQALEAELDRLRSGAAEPADDGLAAELESMTRERNQLAAELAVLRAERSR